MAARIPGSVHEEINLWIDCYDLEKRDQLNLWTDEIIDPNYEWNKLMETSNLLKQKYSFLSDFMKNNRINVVQEWDHDDELFYKSGYITQYKWEESWIKYYIVKDNDEIVEIPHKIIDRNWEEAIDNWYRWEIVMDYLDINTKFLLEHHYDSAWNDQSPLYIIDFAK